MRAFSKTSKLAIIGGSLAVALGTGALAAHAQNATDAPAASASASQLPGKDRDKGNKDGKGPAELAKKLGVSEDKLKEAMDSLRSEGSGEQNGAPISPPWTRSLLLPWALMLPRWSRPCPRCTASVRRSTAPSCRPASTRQCPRAPCRRPIRIPC